jgi:hypothetical protein
MQTSTSTGRRLIWDLPTRVFHWALAGSFLGAYLRGPGLSIVQRIAEGCGGTVRYRRGSGCGLLVEVRLPSPPAG